MSASPPASGLLSDFESGRLDPGSFNHARHVEVALELLADRPFLDAAARYFDGISRLADRADRPEKANLTITVAFLSLLAERLSAGEEADRIVHDVVANRTALSAWYSRERLESPESRATFLLPDRAPVTSALAP